jgi:hypothetical protein
MKDSLKSKDTKDNKHWIQMLINEENGKALTKAINSKDSRIGEITWLSPLKELRYRQYRLYQEQIREKLNLKEEDMDYLPMNQPLWDAIGTSGDTIILVEGDSSFYLVGSSISYLDKLRSRGYKAKLVLLNIMNNQTYIPRHDYDSDVTYKKMFIDMFGRMDTPQDVIILDYYIK